MSVNARSLLIQNKTSGLDPLVDAILTEGSPEADLYLKALDIKTSGLKSTYVESCLLASDDLFAIAELLDMDEDVIETYSKVFYEVAGLDKLSKMELLNVTDRQESLMKIWATSQGLDFIAWRLGRKVSINPIEGLKDLFTTCIYKAKEAIFSGNETEASKEATKWTKLSMDIARLLKGWVLDTDEAKKDIEMALRQVVPDFKGFTDLEDFGQD